MDDCDEVAAVLHQALPAGLLAELGTLLPVRREAVWLARVRLDVGPHPTAGQVADAMLLHSSPG